VRFVNRLFYHSFTNLYLLFTEIPLRAAYGWFSCVVGFSRALKNGTQTHTRPASSFWIAKPQTAEDFQRVADIPFNPLSISRKASPVVWESLS
jgi:hypothetical protein